MLADELKRASPKTQSALLEAMEESQVTSLEPPEDLHPRARRRHRRHRAIILGMSPRAALVLLRASRAEAAASDRAYVTLDDILRVAGPVLAHRLVLATDARVAGATGREVLEGVLASVPVPVGRD